MKNFMRSNLPWILTVGLSLALTASALVGYGVGYKGERWFAPQYWLVVTGQGQAAQTYVATLHGKTWWRPAPDMLVLRDVKFIRVADSQHPEKGLKIVNHLDDLHHPPETLVAVSTVTVLEPVDKYSSMADAIMAMDAPAKTPPAAQPSVAPPAVVPPEVKK